jgi:hypothetical protein
MTHHPASFGRHIAGMELAAEIPQVLAGKTPPGYFAFRHCRIMESDGARLVRTITVYVIIAAVRLPRVIHARDLGCRPRSDTNAIHSAGDLGR